MTELVIGRTDVEHVVVEVLGRAHTIRGDYWDDNWLACRVAASVGGFTADYRAGMHGSELLRFRSGLARMYADLDGDAVLESIEHWISLTVTCHRTGRVSVAGTLDDSGSGTATLSLHLDGLDQTDIPDWLDALAEIDRTYPVLGKP